MSAADNEALVRRWIRAYNDRDTAEEEAVRTADFAAHVPGLPPFDDAGWKQFVWRRAPDSAPRLRQCSPPGRKARRRGRYRREMWRSAEFHSATALGLVAGALFGLLLAADINR